LRGCGRGAVVAGLIVVRLVPALARFSSAAACVVAIA
jgi:hypothetical protein